MKHIEFIKALKEYIEMNLSELVGSKGGFNEGQRYAYVDTLEMVQSNLSEKERSETGLDYPIEEAYPLK